MEPYLKEFLLSVHRQDPPVFFPKRDRLNDLLQLLLTKPPKDLKIFPREECYLEVIVPYFENLNILSYNYLSPSAEKLFAKKVKQMFNVTFIDFMEECFRNDLGKTDSIYLFLEKYNITADSQIEDMLRKTLYRSKRILRKYPRREYRRVKQHRNILSDKHPVMSQEVTNTDN